MMDEISKMKSIATSMMNLVSYVANRWLYYMTPFCTEVKKRGIVPFLTKYSYLLITCTIVLPFSFFGREGSVAKAVAAFFLMTFGGMVMRGIMNYKEEAKKITTFAAMFCDGQEELVDHIDAFFSRQAPCSLDTNDGKAISLLLYVGKRPALKPQIANESYFIEMMLREYGGKFKMNYKTGSILNAKKPEESMERIGREMGLM